MYRHLQGWQSRKRRSRSNDRLSIRLASHLSRIAVVSVLAIFFSGCGNRHVNLTFTSGDQNGILVTDGPATDFTQSYVSAASSIDVGARLGNGEVATFTTHRPVALLTPVDWNNGDATLNLKQEITVPVTIWIVKGPYQSQSVLAFDAAVYTNNVWESERMGLFMTITLNDATNNSKASQYYNFTCSQQSAIEQDVGKTQGQLNIYFVDQVDRGGGSYA